MRRLLLLTLACCLLSAPLQAGEQGVRTQVALSTIRLSNPKSSATGFLVARPDVAQHPDQPLALVTSAHVFERAEGDEMVLTLRKPEGEHEYSKVPMPLKIRDRGQPLWKKHPKLDVAVIPLTSPGNVELAKLSIDLLATSDNLAEIEPGDFVRSFGFPHTPLFDPTVAAFPTVRLGCLASYPIKPSDKQPSFLIDCNTFEGDSGGPVIWQAEGKEPKLIGLIQGQHFINLRYDFPYQSGEIRKQLGLAIVMPSTAILETIALLAKE